ncbi:hypothetical protein [Thermoactinospora rubra]|uniref:hypothetical protein n=1 Tax=Thermoactinospora rubra TaxID=1088767 RepID=UPI000A103AD2|nr:hypothetical protein [Thermoactinospora rubra]
MGLNISPGGASWSYSGFNRFRERLAVAEGFALDEMEGFKPFDAPDTWVGKRWDEVQTSLKPLLDHSDCGGYLLARECEEVLPRLREIVATWPETDYDRRAAEALIAGMEHCVEHGCAMVFH